MTGDVRYVHALDSQLVRARFFSWLGPAFRLAIEHWPFTIGAGLATLGLGTFPVLLPLLGLGGAATVWIRLALGLFVAMLAWSVVEVVAYRLLVEKEGVGAVNDWRNTLIRTFQITAIWWIAVCVVGGAYLLITLISVRMRLNALGQINDVMDFVALSARSWVLSIVYLIVVIVLIPIMMNIMIAGALSTVHAVRSRQTAWSAVIDSLRLAFEQQWRVFWASYVLAVLGIVLSVLGTLMALWAPRFSSSFGFYADPFVSVASTAFGLGMMFVIERAYAAHLTAPDGAEAASPLPNAPPPRRAAPAPGPTAGGPAASAPAAATAAAPQEIAAQIAEDLRVNNTRRLVESVEGGLAADAKFFASQPDSALTLAKRLVALGRSDLALRVVQPYLKEQRAHKQHFTVAVFVADVLARDPRRLADAARFLAQLKTLYPREPLLDQMIKTTDKALAAAGKGAPADPRGAL